MIPVGAGPNEDGLALREAVRHIRSGEALGIFPEGSIARPPFEIRPFLPGAGLLARLGRSPVLLFFIQRTGYCKSAWGSIIKPSHSTIEFLGEYDLRSEKDPAAAVEILRKAIQVRSGWPLNDCSPLEEEQASTL